MKPEYLYLGLTLFALLVVAAVSVYVYLHRGPIEQEAEEFYSNAKARVQAAEADAKTKIDSAEQYAVDRFRRAEGSIGLGSSVGQGSKQP